MHAEEGEGGITSLSSHGGGSSLDSVFPVDVEPATCSYNEKERKGCMQREAFLASLLMVGLAH